MANRQPTVPSIIQQNQWDGLVTGTVWRQQTDSNTFLYFDSLQGFKKINICFKKLQKRKVFGIWPV